MRSEPHLDIAGLDDLDHAPVAESESTRRDREGQTHGLPRIEFHAGVAEHLHHRPGYRAVHVVPVQLHCLGTTNGAGVGHRHRGREDAAGRHCSIDVEVKIVEGSVRQTESEGE